MCRSVDAELEPLSLAGGQEVPDDIPGRDTMAADTTGTSMTSNSVSSASLTRTTSFWFGEGASSSPPGHYKVHAADALTVLASLSE
jgi:hypothetical protein|eukprot:COSAG01_NODE_196_length_22350_cov_812.929136_16_plen_86_part_00